MYRIQYTERNNKKAHDYETKSLLYLLAMREDSDEISIFFIDCLNDITGSCKDCVNLWDTQAKGVSSLNPRKIGNALITLFQNYLSDIDFIHSILIIPKIKEGYLNNENLTKYYFNNFKEEKKNKVIIGVEEEYKKREGITDLSFETKNKLLVFLDKVLFVVAGDKEDYIKEIIQFKNKDSLTLSFYTAIFNEIRDKQSALKNIYIEGKVINHASELLKYNKHLKSNDVKLMVLNRFVGTELFKVNSITFSYLNELKEMDAEDAKDLLLDNHSRLSKTFFDKNNKVAFWRLLENITNTINKNPDENIRAIFKMLDERLLRQVHTLDINSTLFFIALIKDGFKNES